MDDERAKVGDAPVVRILRDEKPQRAEAPPPRSRRPLWLGALMALIAGAVMVAALKPPARQAAAPVAAAPPVAPRSSYAFDDRLAPLLSFGEGPIQDAAHYLARISASDGARWDTLTLGDPANADAMFSVTIRRGATYDHAAPLFVDAARQAAQWGAAVLRQDDRQSLVSARGALEWAPLTLSGPQGERACLGFRFAPGAESDISGMACNGRGVQIDRVGLECLLDRLTLTRAGRDAGLADVLKGEPNRHQGCRGPIG